MKKIILISLSLIFALISCQKEPDVRTVKYQIQGLSSPYKVIYKNASGLEITEKITPLSASKPWIVEFLRNEGELVYLYVEFKEKVPNNMTFSAGIYLDGKSYQQAKNYDESVGDSIFKIRRAGVIPFSKQ